MCCFSCLCFALSKLYLVECHHPNRGIGPSKRGPEEAGMLLLSFGNYLTQIFIERAQTPGKGPTSSSSGGNADRGSLQLTDSRPTSPGTQGRLGYTQDTIFRIINT